MSARKLREWVSESDGAQVLPGCPDAFSARMAEEIGFAAIYVSGAGISNSRYALPDLGFIGLRDVEETVRDLSLAVSVPLIADIDTGFGHAVNASVSARRLLAAGAAGIQIEDQTFPKRCGHFAGKTVVPESTMIAKIAAIREEVGSELFVVARTDALSTIGREAAVARANEYLQASADAVFIEAPRELELIAEFPGRVDGPLVLNIVEGAQTPPVRLRDATDWGYKIVLYANTVQRAAWHAERKTLMHLNRHGDSGELTEDILSWSERQRVVGTEQYLRLGDRYGAHQSPEE